MNNFSPIRDQFIQHINQDKEPDLLHSLLLIGAEHSKDLDFAKFYRDVESLVTRVSAHLVPDMSLQDIALALCHQLYACEGFRGNRLHYYDPKNSFIHEVLARKTGIPISLSILYMAVAKRLGLSLHGVSFPGHFLTKLTQHLEGDNSKDIFIIDPFNGTVLSDADCRERLKAQGINVSGSLGKHLRAASHHDILVRVLNNLKANFLELDDLQACLACCERILLLTPENPQAHLDRGLLYEQLECYSSARKDYQTYLSLAPNSSISTTVRTKIASLPPANTIH